MRWWLMVVLSLVCACDKSPNGGSGSGTDGRAIDGLRERPRHFTTTQGTITTVGDEDLALHYPLPIMAEAKVEHVAKLEAPGKPIVLQMVLKIPVAPSRAASYY